MNNGVLVEVSRGKRQGCLAVITGSRDVRAETPKYGGLVRMASSQHGPDDTLDPLLWKGDLGYTRGRVHYNGLVQFNDDLTVRPELAKSWEVNSDATEFVFELERGVTFHDGKDLTADDVVYTMQQHLGEDSISIGKALVTMIREWKKVDKYTVKAVLDSPNSDLPIILGTFNFKIIQENAHDDPNYFNKGIGTGTRSAPEIEFDVCNLGASWARERLFPSPHAGYCRFCRTLLSEVSVPS